MSAQTPDSDPALDAELDAYKGEIQAVLEDHRASLTDAMSKADRSKEYFSDPTSNDPLELALAEVSRGLEYKHFPDELKKVRTMKKAVQTWGQSIDPRAQLNADDLGGNAFEVKLSFLS